MNGGLWLWLACGPDPAVSPGPAHAKLPNWPQGGQVGTTEQKESSPSLGVDGCQMALQSSESRLRLSRGPLRLVTLVCDPRGFAPRFSASSPLASSLRSYYYSSRVCVPACASVSAVDLAPTPVSVKSASQSDQSRLAGFPPRRVTAPTLLGPLPDCPLLQISQ